MRPTSVLVCLANLIAGGAFAETIDVHLERFRVLSPSVVKQTLQNATEDNQSRLQVCQDKSVENFWNILKAIADEEDFQQKLRGKGALGFQTDNTSDDSRDQHKVNAGLDLARGYYPGEFKFASSVDVRLVESKFEEDVSQLRISYDYYPQPRLEVFAFGSRFSDNFLRIDQRYEAGFGLFVGDRLGGLIKNASNAHATLDLKKTCKARTFLRQSVVIGKEGEDLALSECAEEDRSDSMKQNDQGLSGVVPLEKLLDEGMDTATLTAGAKPLGDTPEWFQCYVAIVGPSTAVTHAKTLVADIQHLWTDAYHAQRKRHGKYRVGAALAFVNELEKPEAFAPSPDVDLTDAERAAVNEVLTDEQRLELEGVLGGAFKVTNNGTVSAPSTQRFRVNVRPTFEWQPDSRWDFMFNWYFKIPVTNQKSLRIDESGNVERLFHWRWDMDAKLEFKVGAVELGQPGTVSAVLRFQQFWDRAPPLFVADGQTAVGRDMGTLPADVLAATVISAPRRHDLVSMALQIQW